MTLEAEKPDISKLCQYVSEAANKDRFGHKVEHVRINHVVLVQALQTIYLILVTVPAENDNLNLRSAHKWERKDMLEKTLQPQFTV